MNRKCDACGKPYEAKRQTSKFCSVACRQRNARGTNLVTLPTETLPSSPVAGTVAATRAELEAAQRLNTHLGQAALALAARIDGATAVMGFAALVKELRATMVEAMKGAPRAADGLDELEARRERKFAGA